MGDKSKPEMRWNADGNFLKYVCQASCERRVFAWTMTGFLTAKQSCFTSSMASCRACVAPAFFLEGGEVSA